MEVTVEHTERAKMVRIRKEGEFLQLRLKTVTGTRLRERNILKINNLKAEEGSRERGKGMLVYETDLSGNDVVLTAVLASQTTQNGGLFAVLFFKVVITLF